MRLTKLDMNGLRSSRFPPHADKSLKVGTADPPLATEAVCDQIAGLYPAADGLRGHLYLVGDLFDGEERLEAVAGNWRLVIAHGVVLLRLRQPGIRSCQREQRTAPALWSQRSTHVPTDAQEGAPWQ